MTVLGYALGHSPLASRIDLIVVTVVFLSILPGIIELTRAKLKARRERLLTGDPGVR
jgi:hypothetical protein